MSSMQRISESFSNSLQNARDVLSFGRIYERVSTLINGRCNTRSHSRRRQRLRDSVRSPPHGYQQQQQHYHHNRSRGEEDFFRQYFGSSRRYLSRSYLPDSGLKEKNIISAIFSIFVIATIATAIVQPKWFSIRGGSCSRKYIGLQEFITFGYLHDYSNRHQTASNVIKEMNMHFPTNILSSSLTETTKTTSTMSTITTRKATTTTSRSDTASTTTSTTPRPPLLNSPLPIEPSKSSATALPLPIRSFLHHSSGPETKNCITPEIAYLQKTIIALCLIVMLLNLMQFLLDMLGTKRSWLNLVRRNAIGSICGVFFIIVIIGIAYIVSTLLEKEQKIMVESGPKITNDSILIEVRFEVSYYLITIAGILGLIGSAFNLFRNPVQYYANSLMRSTSSNSSTPCHHSNNNNNLFQSHQQNTRQSNDDYLNDSLISYASLSSRCPPTITACVPSLNLQPPPPYVP